MTAGFDLSIVARDRWGKPLPAMPKTGVRKHAALYKRAHEAGMKAGKAVNPTPMFVRGDPNWTKDTRTYYVPQGVCGFAEIRFPARGGFQQWARATEKARKSDYQGGAYIWVREFDQSMERKAAYADAFAAVLREAGIQATAHSKED